MQSEPLLQAIKIIGSRQKVVKILGISRQRLNSWLNNHVSMGYEHALILEYLTHGEVTANELVPEKTKIFTKLNLTVNLTTGDGRNFSKSQQNPILSSQR